MKFLHCKIIFSAAFSALFLTLYGANEEFQREMLLGNTAAENLDFRRAAECYSTAAKFAGDDAVLYGEAAERLGGALLRSGEIAEAEKLLVDWKKRFPDEDSTRMAMLEAELLIAGRKYAEAEKKLDRFFSGRPIKGGNYLPLLNLRALAQFRQGKYNEAADNYGMLEAFARGGAMEFPAWVRKTISLFESKRFAEADRSLADTARFTDPKQRRDVENLRLLGMLYRNELKKFSTEWEKIRPANEEEAEQTGADIILSELCLRAGRLFAGAEPAKAEEFLRLAFHYADTESAKKLILLELAELQEKNNRVSAAAETLKKYLSFFPETPPNAALMIRAAKLFKSAGNNNEALDLLRNAASDRANGMEVRRTAQELRSELLAAAGQKSAGAEEIHKLIDESETAADKFENTMLLGDFYFRLKDYRSAATAFSDAVSLAKNQDRKFSSRAGYWQLQSLMGAKSYKEAEKAAKNLLSFPEYREQAINSLGNIYELTGNLAEAAKQYELLLREFPAGKGASDALYRSAAVEEKRKNFSAASDLYRKFAENYPGHESAPAALYSACECAHAAGDAASSAKHLAFFKHKYPTNPLCTAAMLKECDVLKAAGKYDNALKTLDEILLLRGGAVDKMLRFQIMLDRAKIFKLKGDSGTAVLALEKLAGENPPGEIGAETAFLLGNYRFDRGKYAESIALYRKGLEQAEAWQKPALSGRLADACFSQGSTRSDRKLLEEAREIYTALGSQGNNINFKLQCLYKAGKTAEALGDLKSALRDYREVLYLAQAGKKSGRVMPDEAWVGRALHGAVGVLSRDSSIASGREIIRLIRLFSSMGYGKTENLQPIINDTVKRYHLHGKSIK